MRRCRIAQRVHYRLLEPRGRKQKLTEASNPSTRPFLSSHPAKGGEPMTQVLTCVALRVARVISSQSSRRRLRTTERPVRDHGGDPHKNRRKAHRT